MNSPEPVGIGLDFGTTNSTIAIRAGDGVSYVELDPGADNSMIMPSAVYVTRDGSHLVGHRALLQYLDDNAGRVVRLKKVDVGEIALTFSETDSRPSYGGSVGDTTYRVRVRGAEDTELPGRLFRGLKSFLGVAAQERFSVCGRRYRIVALITLMLTRIREVIEEAGFGSNPSIHIGRPVRYGYEDGANGIALARMREACHYAGLGGVTYYPEPVAATVSYLEGRGLDSGTYLTFDFGGGTLDLALLEVEGPHYRVLGTHGVPIGGNRVDQMIIERHVFPEIGEGVPLKSSRSLRETDTVFPFYQFAEYLLNWQTAYMVNQPHLIEAIFDGMRSSADESEKLERLWRLIRGNYAYSLLAASEEAKQRLAETSRTDIELPEIDLRVPLDRSDLEAVLVPVLDEIGIAIDTLLSGAGVAADDLDAVVTTGGSSQLIPVRSLLEDRFGDRVVAFDYYRSIAAGLAIADYRGHEVPID